ncbi:MAG: transposase [Candidatus Angelobacter sp.]
MAKRKNYGSAQKFAAALSVISGSKTSVEAARDLGCHPTMVTLWKKEVEDHGARVFESNSETNVKNQKIAKLERLIGRLTVESDFLERVLGSSDGA